MSEEKETKETEAENTTKTEESKESKGVTLDDVKEVVNKALEPFKRLLDNDHSDDSGDKKKSEDDGGDKDTPAKTRRTLSQIEEDAENLVSKAVEKILGDKETQEKNQKKEDDKKKKPETQKPPAKHRFSTRLMLGKNHLGDYDNR